MAKNVIFFIHGVGQHGQGWSTAEGGPGAELLAAANHYPRFSEEEPLSESVIFHEIRYDDVFDKVVQRWGEEAKKLGDAFGESTNKDIANVKALADKFATVGGDSWWARVGLDVPLYVLFKPVQRLVQLRVISAIMTAVAKYRLQDGNTARKFLVVAHSLGTTVAHDALDGIARGAWLAKHDEAADALQRFGFGQHISADDLKIARERYGSNPFGPGTFHFESIMMISNTSGLLHQSSSSPGKSHTKPSFTDGQNNCKHFCNVDHVFDPIADLELFRAEKTWPRAASRGTARDIFGLTHIYDVNVHGFGHYLKHPLVHREILFRSAPHKFKAADYAAAATRIEDGGDFLQWGPGFRDEDKLQELMDAYGLIEVRGQLKKHQKYIQTAIALGKVTEALRNDF